MAGSPFSDALIHVADNLKDGRLLLAFGVIIVAAVVAISFRNRGLKVLMGLFSLVAIVVLLALWPTPHPTPKPPILDCKSASGVPGRGNHPFSNYTIDTQSEKDEFKMVAFWCEVAPMSVDQNQSYTLIKLQNSKDGTCELITPPERTVTATAVLCRAIQ
jgi:hypothetical protein